MNCNTLENSLNDLIDKYSVEDILFSLYCCADNRAKNLTDSNLQKDLAKQIHALNVACELIEEEDSDESYCLIY
jgi:hypothetical protein